MKLYAMRRTNAARRAATGLALTGLMWTGACADGTGPESVRIAFPGLVSNPVTGTTAASSRALPVGGAKTVAYVSLVPGSLSGGDVAVIRNLHSGSTVIATMTDGGFDPVPVDAAVRDTLEIEIRQAGGATLLQFTALVPASARPSVVRTSPPDKQRLVIPTTVPKIVFSEPVDPATLTGASVQLRTGGHLVPGQLEFQGPDHVLVAFVPESLLAGSTEYTLAISDAVRDLDGDLLERLVKPRFTTAGSAPPVQIVFSTPGGFGRERSIHGMNADGTGRRTVITLSGDEYPVSWDPYPWGRLAWSPDGTKLALQTGGALFVINADGSHLEMLGAQPGSTDILNDAPAWSPDGTKIAFASFTWYWADQGTGIYLTDSSAFTGGVLKPADRLTEGYDWWPAWSPDGKRIAFARFEATYFLNPGLTSASDIYVMNADGSAVERLTNQRWPVSGLAWSPDGEKIAFSADLGGCQPTFVMNADGSGLTSLTGCPGVDRSPSWSPDGTRIVFERDEDIYIMKADGSGITRLTWDGAVQPAWSPRP